MLTLINLTSEHQIFFYVMDAFAFCLGLMYWLVTDVSMRLKW